ncbi:initiation-control protein [Liquorilactobacillus mali KCTC 3596 = DSM 20444]|uniref:Initiation-control protein n=1 Tax=Liquorilactobacillus mali KCTC 3596 = DSM 20444 TaxID=1046596 RepID=A0A0R2E0V3_9LACO|nr:initiation-control protein [Liquorilactobacillus mali KCTC 3596 = DSM 20444]
MLPRIDEGDFLNKRELYDGFSDLGAEAQKMIEKIELIKSEMTKVIEKNAELEIENQHLRAHLKELEEQKQSDEQGGLSKSRKNLEMLYEEGFHVCNVDSMYGTRRINDEPCVFCQDVIYGERRQ